MGLLTEQQKRTLNKLIEYEPGLKRGLLDADIQLGDLLDSARLEVFSNVTRPSPASRPAGTAIFNTDDNAPNYSDGLFWRDSTGVIT